MKKHMEQFWENLMKNLLDKLQDSKKEMKEKLNHVMVQRKSYAESVQSTTQEKNHTPNETYIDFRAIMEGSKNAEIVEEKERYSVPRTSLSMMLKNLLVTTRMILLNLTMPI